MDEYLSPFVVQDERLQQLASHFSRTYRQLALTSNNQFLPTPVTNLPTGRERGRILALDLGGSNLRVGLIELNGTTGRLDSENPSHQRGSKQCKGRLRESFVKSWPIGDHLKMDKTDDLFAWIGDCIAEVVTDIIGFSLHHNKTVSRDFALGITFSFPMIQSSLAEATIMPMGKGFAITSNLDLSKLILAGYENAREKAASNTDYPVPIKRLPNVHVVAITNDTVAILASLAFITESSPDRKVAMAMIVGTGTNATIPMRLVDLHPSKAVSYTVQSSHSNHIVVNTEWSINGTLPPLQELGLITKWDKLLDDGCERPGFQPFEQMTSGRYLGELARLVLLDVFVNQLKFRYEDIPDKFKERNGLTTTLLARIVAKTAPEAHITNLLEEQFPSKAGAWHWSMETAKTVWTVAERIQVRASSLVAGAIIGLLDCVGDFELSNYNRVDIIGASDAEHDKKPQADDIFELLVAYTGATINLFPRYLDTCQDRVNELLQLGKYHRRTRVTLVDTPNGGLVGAAVLAATLLDSH